MIFFENCAQRRYWTFHKVVSLCCQGIDIAAAPVYCPDPGNKIRPPENSILWFGKPIMNTEKKEQGHVSIGFIGAGNMAEAMIAALLRTGAFLPGHIAACDIQPERIDYIEKTYNIRVLSDSRQIIEQCDIVVLAVKPQQMADLLADAAGQGSFDVPAGRRLIISIAAGIKLETFEKWIYAGKTASEKDRLPIVRVMPNTPALAGAGMCAFSANAVASRSDIDVVRGILAAMGDVIHCGEAKMDAVTAVSGSGPAYCFYFIESMLEAGEKAGLTPEEALRLTLSTVKGALRLIEVQGASPAELRRRVTSPGGTTEAAIRVFDDHGLKEILIKGILAAAERSEALSRPD